MSALVQELLEKYQTLSEEDQYEFNMAFREHMPQYGDLPVGAMDEIANEMFIELDRAEAANGTSTY